MSHHDVLLLGPRRIGKTSVARAVIAQARSVDWHAVEINVASGSDETAFLEKLTQAVKAEEVSFVGQTFDWFRNDVRALPGSSKVRWLVSGSVGLDTLVQQHGMADTINSLNHQGLEPFAEPVALAMLARLADHYGISLTKQDAQCLVDAIRWLQPYYLQLVFNHLGTLIHAADADWSVCVDQALEEMIQLGGDNDFHHWEGRLSLQLTREGADHAVASLDLAARNPAGERPETLSAALEERLSQQTSEEVRAKFLQLRDILQRDAYWWPDEASGNRRYRFCLEPLRRWWVRRRSL